MMNHNLWILLMFGVILGSCTKKTTSKTPLPTQTAVSVLKVPDTTVHKSALHYNRKKSLWTLNNKLYSGYVVRFHEDSKTLLEKFGVLKGKKENKAIQWFVDGRYERITEYHNGKHHGFKKTWSSDSLHTLLAHLNYDSGKLHGVQRKWYPTGELFKKMNFNNGKEEGIQQAFRKNGVIYANYQARKGRIFGLKKAALCYSIKEEKVQYSSK